MQQQNATSVASPAGEKILPSNDRLLNGIRSALQRIALRTGDDHTRSELGAIDVIIGELILRHQPAYYIGYYGDLRALADEGLGLLQSKLSAKTTAFIKREIEALPTTLDPALDFDVMGLSINRVLGCLEHLIEAARGDVPAPIRNYVTRVVAKENEFQSHRIPAPAAAPKAIVQPAYTAFSAASLQAYLRRKFPQRQGLRVTQFKQLVGGYQKITALFDIEDASGKKESLVLRAEKDDRFLTLDAGNVVDEYEIVRIAYEAGIPVAKPMWLEADTTQMGYCFFVSQKVAGENYGSAIGADKPISGEIARSFIATMAMIHKTPVNAAMRRSKLGHWLDHRTLEASTLANVCYWRDQTWMQQANPSPLYRRLTTWLVDNVPRDTDALRLTHGDFGPHNVLVDAGKVSGVLDWEAAYIGDQAQDIAWFLQSCGGKISDADALDWYEAFTGWRISEYRLRFYDVFNTLKILTGALSACPMFETLENASIEWCNIPLRWAPFSSAQVEAKIAAAEAVGQRPR